MAVSPARAAAFEILLKVEREQSYASDLLHSARFGQLSPADHGLATELVMGVLRWRSWLDRQLGELSSQRLERLDEEVLAALRLGIYQLKFLTRVPARVAIFESVELVKKARKSSAGSFVNAVLRKMIRASPAEHSESTAGHRFAEIEKSSDPAALARHSAHPDWLATRWAERYGIERARQICLYDQHVPPTSIHIYDHKCVAKIEGDGIELAMGQFTSDARRVVSGDVTRTRCYREGRIAIQDEGSQLVAMLVGRGGSILDCCAAPGGKTAVVASRNSDSMVIASELHPHRARLLRGLVRLPNVRVVAADARQLPFSRGFDRVLADVPCSGTGTLARNPEIKWRLKAEDLHDLQSRQIAILKSALERLAPGGVLVYSTCSIEREENEAVVEAVVGGSAEFSIVDCQTELERLRLEGELRVKETAILLDGLYLRTIPGVHACDGFFAAMIEKVNRKSRS